MGSVPMIAAMVVIMIGRKRIKLPFTAASAGIMLPLRSLSIAKSTTMMAFFFTMPISMMMPTNPKRSSCIWKSINVASAPNAAAGSPERMVSG